MTQKRDKPGGGTPSKKTKDKEGTGCTPCISCNKIVKEGSIQCENCFKWEHRECVGVSAGEFNVLTGCSPNIMFFCSSCQPKVTMALKFFHDVQDKQNSLETRIHKLENELEKLTQAKLSITPSPTGTNQSQIPETMQTDATTQNQPAHSKTTDKTSPFNVERSPVADRKCNIVVYNIGESAAGTTRVTRMKNDLDKLSDLFS